MGAAAHTDIECIGTHGIDTDHILFEAGIVGTDGPAIDLSLHLPIQHGAEVITTSIEGLAQLRRIFECLIILDAPVDILEAVAP